MTPEQLVGAVLAQWAKRHDLLLPTAHALATEAVAVMIREQQQASGAQPPKADAQPWADDTRGMGA